MTLDFIVTTQLEMFLKDYISHHTHSGKYHGSKQIRQMYYKLKQHNLESLSDRLYSKRAKRTKDLGGTF